MLRKVGLDAVFFAPAEGRVCQNNVDTVGLRVADVRPCQRVVMADKGRVVDIVEQQVGDAEHVRELLFLGSAKRLLHLLLVGGGLHVALAHVADRAREKTTGATSRIEQDLPWVRIETIGHERRDGARRVVFTRVAGALEVVQNLLVDIAEVLAFGEVVEVDGVDLVDYLAHELAGLHVVVGILEDFTYYPAAAVIGGAGQFLERGE